MNIFEAISLLQQFTANIQQLRLDVVRNAEAHAAALGNGEAVEAVRTDLLACGEQYARRIEWMEALLSDPVRRGKLSAAVAPWGEAACMQEADRQASEARALITLWNARPKQTAEDLLALCTEARQLVTPADTLWPA